MAVYKDKWNGYKGDTWRVAVYYKDWKGVRRKHEKRGFATKKEALAYEREYIAKTSKDTNIGFDTFVDIYMSDIKPQIKLSTYVTKENIIDAHIRSYFENKSLSEITANDILQWQNALLSLRDDDGKGYQSLQNGYRSRKPYLQMPEMIKAEQSIIQIYQAMILKIVMLLLSIEFHN